MRFRPKHRRGDGSFVIALDVPSRGVVDYHVTVDDPLFAAVAEAAEGLTLEDEPPSPSSSPPRVIATGDFMERFTEAERIAIRQAARAATPAARRLDDALDLIRVRPIVDLGSVRIQGFVSALVAADLLPDHRVAEILG
jgi:hypothetical protein